MMQRRQWGMEDYWIERGGGKEKRQKYSKLEFKVLLLCLWEGKLENPLKYPPPSSPGVRTVTKKRIWELNLGHKEVSILSPNQDSVSNYPL